MTNEEITLDKLETARERLVIAEPGYATFILQADTVILSNDEAQSLGIGTMATDGRTLFVNVDGVASKSIDVLVATLIEEAKHVLDKHHIRMIGLDRDAFNIAADVRIRHDLEREGYTVNPDMIAKQSEYDCFADDHYDVEAIYDVIVPDDDDQDDDDQNDDTQDEDEQDEVLQDDSDDTSDDDQPDGSNETSDEQSENGEETSEKAGNDNDSNGKGDNIVTDAIPSDGAVLPMPSDDGGDFASEAEIAEESRRIDELTIEAHRACKGMGIDTPGLAMKVDEILRKRDDVARAIAHMIQYARSNETSWSTPNRRYVSSGLYLPGPKQQQKLRIAIGFDTSGSMSTRDYNDCLDLTWGILTTYDVERVDLVQIDTTIHSIETIEEHDDVTFDQTRRGFGGSNMIPFFDHIDAHDSPDYDCAILFTDGGVMWPTREPDTTTLIVYVGTYLSTQDAPIATTMRLA